MELALRLDRADSPLGRTEALFLASDDAALLASVCVSLGGSRLPEVYRIHGGFLVIAREAPSRTPPGAVRLRRLAGDLYLPVDARLRPALLSEEIVALTARQGLVVLPGGLVLAFDPNQPVELQQWLSPPRIQRANWESFPRRPDRAERLHSVERPIAPVGLTDLLNPGAPDDTQRLDETGSSSGGAMPEDVRPPSGSTLGRMLGGLGLGAASFMVWLGRQIGAPGLARRGGELARWAIESIPRLTECIIGEQEAALREVLRQLQSGDIEKALRRAPIAVGDPDQPASVAADAHLGARDPRYSLRDLIGGGGGAARVWVGGGDVWNDLAREYRRLAQEAMARGDYRRAAYLHGVLLRDLRSAASALMAGGLFRDAALLFRDRLKDFSAAADAFERSGDHDEALRLYERCESFEQAAELLRKLGETERALAYYLRAAEQLAARGRWLAAGDLLRKQAGENEHANRYYRLGWESASAETEVCGERLLDAHLITENIPATTALLQEAEKTLASRASDTGRFFNYAIRATEGFLPAERRGDLIDRTRLLFAGHLRTAGRAAEALASELFGQQSAWPAPVVRDALFAVRGVDRRPGEVTHEAQAAQVKLIDGAVAAVAVARSSFDVIVAAEKGVVCWRPGEGRSVPVCDAPPGNILAISTDRQASNIYLLSYERSEFTLRCFTANRSGEFSRTGSSSFGGLGDDEASDSRDYRTFHLQDTAEFRDGDYRVTVCTDAGRFTFQGAYLKNVPLQPFQPTESLTFLLAEYGAIWQWDWHDGFLHYRSSGLSTRRSNWEHLPVCWIPGVPAGSQRSTPVLDWLTPGPGLLEVTGIDAEGALYWMSLDVRDASDRKSRTAAKSHKAGYVVACLLAPGAVAAATSENEIHWFRISGDQFRQHGISSLDALVRVFALVASPRAREVIAILADGVAIRLKQPCVT